MATTRQSGHVSAGTQLERKIEDQQETGRAVQIQDQVRAPADPELARGGIGGRGNPDEHRADDRDGKQTQPDQPRHTPLPQGEQADEKQRESQQQLDHDFSLCMKRSTRILGRGRTGPSP